MNRQPILFGRMSLAEWVMRVAFAVLVVVLFIGLWSVRNAVMQIFLAVIVALALQGPIHRFERWAAARRRPFVTLVLVLVIGGLLACCGLDRVEQVQESWSTSFPTRFVRCGPSTIACRTAWRPAEIDWDALMEGQSEDWLSSRSARSTVDFPSCRALAG